MQGVCHTVRGCEGHQISSDAELRKVWLVKGFESRTIESSRLTLLMYCEERAGKIGLPATVATTIAPFEFGTARHRLLIIKSFKTCS